MADRVVLCLRTERCVQVQRGYASLLRTRILDAQTLIGSKAASSTSESADSGKSELERRKQAAKQKAMERMKAQAAKFAEQMKIETEEPENEGMDESINDTMDVLDTPRSDTMSPRRRFTRSSTGGSESFHSASTSGSRSPHRSDLGIPQFFSMYSSGGDVLLDDSDHAIPDQVTEGTAAVYHLRRRRCDGSR